MTDVIKIVDKYYIKKTRVLQVIDEELKRWEKGDIATLVLKRIRKELEK